LLIHVGEYHNPAIIDERKTESYKLEYAKFDENGKVIAKGAQHADPEFEGFTYGDDPNNKIKRNLGKLDVGDYIFFMWTFSERKCRQHILNRLVKGSVDAAVLWNELEPFREVAESILWEMRVMRLMRIRTLTVYGQRVT